MGAFMASAVVLSGCSTRKIADNTTDAVVFVGKTAVNTAAGAGQLVMRGAAAGARRLQEPAQGYPAGTVVCLNDAGEISAAAVTDGDEGVCPPQEF
ncbi:hypothetical protein Ga0609869_000081 [Rhodovulum iodosum]|uniref:Lipoprotein n=1 Tax=Rhodovulum iodosum TaxID=68291 RepID=A0ABV3XNP3_9RHOB|nr:hypothetical protein [Rhodovulum robiginosum]RSK35865.1 hypothetical protein EJA01_05830 [Rhodovulum robiginosum]